MAVIAAALGTDSPVGFAGYSALDVVDDHHRLCSGVKTAGCRGKRTPEVEGIAGPLWLLSIGYFAPWTF